MGKKLKDMTREEIEEMIAKSDLPEDKEIYQKILERRALKEKRKNQTREYVDLPFYCDDCGNFLKVEGTHFDEEGFSGGMGGGIWDILYSCSTCKKLKTAIIPMKIWKDKK